MDKMEIRRHNHYKCITNVGVWIFHKPLFSLEKNFSASAPRPSHRTHAYTNTCINPTSYLCNIQTVRNCF